MCPVSVRCTFAAGILYGCSHDVTYTTSTRVMNAAKRSSGMKVCTMHKTNLLCLFFCIFIAGDARPLTIRKLGQSDAAQKSLR